MSAYIVGNETINGVLAFVERPSRSGDFDYAVRTFLRSPAVAIATPPLMTAEPELIDWGHLGQTIYALNVDAVSQRYPGESIETLPGPVDVGYAYERSQRPSAVQVFKSLGCLLYQCSEGNVPDKPLYQALENLKRDIAECIVYALPEYDQAKWG